MKTSTIERKSRLSRRLLVLVWAALLVTAGNVKAAPVKTLVQDTLYRADGSVAHGSVILRWNGFSTSAGEAVAAGQMTVQTDATGAISVALIPNTGATPSGSYYRAVIKLDDGTTSEEQWVVPAAASTTIAAIRAQTVPQAVAAQFVSRDYVDSALAAMSPTVVHIGGVESVTGAKSFVVSPEVPAPADAAAVANKGYVDQEIAGLATVASTGNYNDLVNKPAAMNLAAPGAIGSTTPGTVNATSYAVNGTALASTNLSDTASLARLASPTFTGTLSVPTINVTAALQINGSAIASTNLSDTASLVYNTGSYVNPSWLSSLSWSKLTSTPTTATGYGIASVDAVAIGQTTPAAVTGTAITAKNAIQKLPQVDVTHPDFGTPASCANAADPTGTLDSTCAINAAITYQQTAPLASNENPVLHLPAGTYKISSELRIPSTLHVKGDGKNATILKFTNDSAYAGVVITGLGNQIPPDQFVANGSLENLTLYASDGYLFPGTLLEIAGNSGYALHNVRVANGGGRGVNLIGNAERFSSNDLEIDTVRWPLVSLVNEAHFWKTQIQGAGQDANNYCWGANCVNGVHFNTGWTGTFTLVSATGNGTTATYVVSCSGVCPASASTTGTNAGYSPIPAGDWFTISGITDVTGLNGTFQAASVVNNSGTSQFTLTATNATSGTAAAGTWVFQPTVIPETHAAALLGGYNVEFNGGSIKPLWYADGIQVLGGQAVTVQNVYFEGFPLNGFPTSSASIVVNGLGVTTTLTSAMPAGACPTPSGTTEKTAPGTTACATLASTAWVPAYVSDPQDIAQQDNYLMYIAPQDYDPTVTTQSAFAPAGVMRNMYEGVLAGTSYGSLYVISRNYSGSTAPSNTAWPSGSLVLTTSTAQAGHQVTSINNHFNSFATPNAKWASYCADSEAVGTGGRGTSQHACAAVKVGQMPDGLMNYPPYTSGTTPPWANGGNYTSINDSIGCCGGTEAGGNGWIKSFAVGNKGNIIGVLSTLQEQYQTGETNEVMTGQYQTGSNVKVQAVQNVNGASTALPSNINFRNYNTDTAATYQPGGQSVAFAQKVWNTNFTDTLLGNNPGSIYPQGEQYATSYCYWDVGVTGTYSGHAQNRLCFEGAPGLTGSSAGFEYDTWSGSAWTQVFRLSGNSTMTLTNGANLNFTPASIASNRTITIADPGGSATLAYTNPTTTQTLTGTTFDTAGSGNTFKVNGTAISAKTGSGSVVLATSPALTTPTTNSIAGTGTATFAAGGAAGSSPGTPTCTTSHVCDSMSGTISFTVGTSTTTGSLLTVTTGVTRTNQPNCHGAVYLAASPYTALPVRLTYTTTTIVFNVGTAPTASTAYELVYAGCGGN
jgi:hypothetical protein